MTEIKLQKHGHDVAVTIFGSTELEIEQTHWSFFNHGATSSELAWNHDRTNAYFWVCHNKDMTGLEKFERAFTNICLFKILNENPDAFKGEKGGALPLARKMAKEKIEEMDTCYALSKNSNVVIDTHKTALPIEHTNQCDFTRILKQEYGRGALNT
mgnify:CR=1 FL=1